MAASSRRAVRPVLADNGHWLLVLRKLIASIFAEVFGWPYQPHSSSSEDSAATALNPPQDLASAAEVWPDLILCNSAISAPSSCSDTVHDCTTSDCALTLRLVRKDSSGSKQRPQDVPVSSGVAAICDCAAADRRSGFWTACRSTAPHQMQSATLQPGPSLRGGIRAVGKSSSFADASEQGDQCLCRGAAMALGSRTLCRR